MKDCKNYSLLPHNTFGIEAQCARFLEYTDEQEALQVATILRNTSSPYIIIGGGSNLLLTRDFEGIVVHSACKGIRREGNRLTCGSGEVFDDVVAESIKMGLYGAENLSLIPGDVGASAVQNIGAYGAEAKDLIRSIRAVEIATSANMAIVRVVSSKIGRISISLSVWNISSQKLSIPIWIMVIFVLNWSVRALLNLLPNNCVRPLSISVMLNCPTPKYRAMQAVSL